MGAVSLIVSAGVTKVAKAKFAIGAFVVVGGLAASTVSERGTFLIAFFWIMFGGIAAAVAMFAGANQDVAVPQQRVPDPFTDELGVQRYPGDALDLENHPRPGANGRF